LQIIKKISKEYEMKYKNNVYEQSKEIKSIYFSLMHFEKI